MNEDNQTKNVKQSKLILGVVVSDGGDINVIINPNATITQLTFALGVLQVEAGPAIKLRKAVEESRNNRIIKPGA